MISRYRDCRTVALIILPSVIVEVLERPCASYPPRAILLVIPSQFISSRFTLSRVVTRDDPFR